MYIGRKRGFGPVSVHVEDENVNLFPDDDDGKHTKLRTLSHIINFSGFCINEEKVICYQL